MDIRDLLLNASTPEPCFYKKRVPVGKFEYSIHFEMYENLMTVKRIKRIDHKKKRQLIFSRCYEQYNTTTAKPVESIELIGEVQEKGVQTHFSFTSCKDMAVQTVECGKSKSSADAAIQTESGPVYKDKEMQTTTTTFCNAPCQTYTFMLDMGTSMDQQLLALTSSSLPQNVATQTIVFGKETRGVQAQPNVEDRSTKVEFFSECNIGDTSVAKSSQYQKQHDCHAHSPFEEPPPTKHGVLDMMNEISNVLMKYNANESVRKNISDIIHQYGEKHYDPTTKTLLLKIIEEIYKPTVALSHAKTQEQLISKEPIAARHNAQVIQKHNKQTRLKSMESTAAPSKVPISAVSLKTAAIKKDIEKRPAGGHESNKIIEEIYKPTVALSHAKTQEQLISKEPIAARHNAQVIQKHNKQTRLKSMESTAAPSKVPISAVSLKTAAIKKDIEKRPAGGHESKYES